MVLKKYSIEDLPELKKQLVEMKNYELTCKHNIRDAEKKLKEARSIWRRQVRRRRDLELEIKRIPQRESRKRSAFKRLLETKFEVDIDHATEEVYNPNL